MKKIILFISLLISFNLYSQKSPMDVYEDNMKEEYRLHDIATITNYILQNKEVGKSEFILNGRRYKMKVKETVLSGGLIRSDNSRSQEWVEGESLQFVVKHMHREYVYTLRGNELQLWSDNLSFLAYYDFDKQEVSIRTHNFHYTRGEQKMYGYDYSFAGNKLEKVQDWIVRDALGRAHSMGKVYPKRK